MRILCLLLLPHHHLLAREVSVCRDATYDIPLSRGAICVGSGSAPAGTNCPIKGEKTQVSCKKGLASFQAAQGDCVAIEDAICVIVNNITSTWGCVFPSIGCSVSRTANVCPIWTFHGSEKVTADLWKPVQCAVDTITDQKVKEEWFVQETPVSDLVSGCKNPDFPMPTPLPSDMPYLDEDDLKSSLVKAKSQKPTFIKTSKSINQQSSVNVMLVAAAVTLSLAMVIGAVAFMRYRARSNLSADPFEMHLVLTPK